MDNNELKCALLNKKPVIYKNSYGVEAEYKCVSAIRYTEENGRIKVSAEITDVSDRSITLCDPARLRYKERDDQ